tara:strand:- start:1500 stop:1733 length:234 start_codon:yes stop_codon:yes gene_type:complete
MKNPVFISNKKEQVVYIYRIFDNSMLQLAKLDEFSTTVLNIPKNSVISIKRCHHIGDFLIPKETLYECELSMNHLVL